MVRPVISLPNIMQTEIMVSTIASYYAEGTKGVPQDLAKAKYKLYHEAGELGCVGAYCKYTASL